MHNMVNWLDLFTKNQKNPKKVQKSRKIFKKVLAKPENMS